MSSAPLTTPDAERHHHERELRDRGFVPVTAHDAPYPHFDTLLPACSIEQVAPERHHGRVVWSHPSRSGLDPRAVALAIVRVADGIGPDPLDPPLALDEAARWLLAGDVEPWLCRPEHRILVRYDDASCLYESTGRAGRCLTHPLLDPLLQQVADALGDLTHKNCRPRRWTEPHCVVWEKEPGREHDIVGVARCALAATRRLGDVYRDGLIGAAAWEIARGGGEDPATELPLELPPPPEPDPSRGLGGFVRWKISCHQPQRYLQMVQCRLCGVRDDTSPCRTCTAEQRTQPRDGEWREFAKLETLHACYGTGSPQPAVTCGNANCRTPLALSATGAEGMQK